MSVSRIGTYRLAVNGMKMRLMLPLIVAPFILLGWLFSTWLSENTALAKPYEIPVSVSHKTSNGPVRIISLTR